MLGPFFIGRTQTASKVFQGTSGSTPCRVSMGLCRPPRTWGPSPRYFFPQSVHKVCPASGGQRLQCLQQLGGG